MSLAELMTEIQCLPRLEKIRLIQFMAQELERDEIALIEAGRSYPLYSHDICYSAAAILLETLEAEKSRL